MMRRLLFMHSRIDALWRRFAAAEYDRDGGSPAIWCGGHDEKLPYRADVCGWRRWLGERGIGFAEIFGAEDMPELMILACGLEGVPVRVHVTGRPSHAMLERCKRQAWSVVYYVCYDDWSYHRLRTSGIDVRQITRGAFRLDDTTDIMPREALRKELLDRAGCQDASDKLLLITSLYHPWDKNELRCDVQAAALLRHLYKKTFLAVAGPVREEERAAIAAWEVHWQVKGMVLWADDEDDLVKACGSCPRQGGACDWGALVSASDAVITGGQALANIARYEAARIRTTPIIGTGDFFEWYGQAKSGVVIKNSEPRTMAAAILQLMKEKGLMSALGFSPGYTLLAGEESHQAEDNRDIHSEEIARYAEEF